MGSATGWGCSRPEEGPSSLLSQSHEENKRPACVRTQARLPLKDALWQGVTLELPVCPFLSQLKCRLSQGAFLDCPAHTGPFSQPSLGPLCPSQAEPGSPLVGECVHCDETDSM